VVQQISYYGHEWYNLLLAVSKQLQEWQQYFGLFTDYILAEAAIVFNVSVSLAG